MALVSALILLTGCHKEAGPLVIGTAEFLSETEFAINYMPDGNMFLAQPVFITPDSVGHYEFDRELEEGSGDYEVLLGNSLYGVHLEKGKTVVMNVKETEPGKYDVSFEGDNAEVSEVVSTILPAYDLYTYSSMSDEEASAEEFLARLDKAHKQALEKVSGLSDQTAKEWYTELSEAKYLGTKARILQDKATDLGIKPMEMPEYRNIIDGIDPNNDASYYSYNSLLWVAEQVSEEVAVGGNMLPSSLETMKIVEEKITNEKVRKMETYSVAHQFFAYGDHRTGKEEFWARYKEFAKDYPEFIKAFEAEYNKEVKDLAEASLPEGLQLTQPDGKKVAIETLWSKGKYTYVDCWATWCGPCCKEIPHLEKLVEKMADQDKVQFVSFSMDSDVDAWKKKLDSDQPQWAQYILDAEASQALSEALTINGIPRFFIIGPDGSIVDPDTKRPSDDSLEEMLRNLE